MAGSSAQTNMLATHSEHDEDRRRDVDGADPEPRIAGVAASGNREREATGHGSQPYPRQLMVKRPPAGTIPESPGSYQFKDAQGRVIYVGKAANLRQRLSNYFGDPRLMHQRTAQMVTTAESVEWTTVRNEVEALMLEYSLIKEHDPRFNVRLRDDKSYPFLAVTVDEQWPRALVMRGRKRKGTRYFGPYAHAYAIRDTLDELLRSFPIRTCSPAKFRQHERLGRPCLLYHIEKCSGPCVGEIDEMPYRQLVNELCDFLDGDTEPILHRLEREMREAATELEFERAARLRDRLATVRRAIERQQMVVEGSEDLDVIGLAEDELEASVQVFYVRKGRVVGRKGFVVDKVEDLTPGGLIDRILEHLYGDDPPQGVPKQVLVPVEPDDLATYEEWLCLQRGSRVQVRVPRRGDKRAAAGDGHPQRLGGVHPPPPAPGERPQHAQPGAHRAAAAPRAAGGAAAHRVLRHGPPPGHRLRRLDGRARGRAAEQAGVPPVQGPRRRQRRLRGDGGGAHAPAHGLPRRAGASTAASGASGPASSPTRRSCSSSTAARDSSASPSASCASSGWTTRSRSPGWPSASRRCTSPAGRSRSRSPAAARRCSCCSASATRPTGSPTRSTASGAASG